MENLKIRVNSEAESKEAQELFFELGLEWFGTKKEIHQKRKGWFFNTKVVGVDCLTYDQYNEFDLSNHKEITLPELRAMVNPMKEYLVPDNGGYRVAVQDVGLPIAENWIAIPEGAVKFLYSKENSSNYHFSNEKNKLMSLEDINCGNPYWYGNAKSYMKQCKVDVLWQREQDEPFLTPEATLNNQYEEIEKVRQESKEIYGIVKVKSDLNFGAAQSNGGVDATLAERQSTYGNFEDVAFVTENIMQMLAKVRPDGLNDLPNTHRMALYMIASKMARIVNGDFNHLDSWHDIGGYAKLIEKLINGE